MSNPKPKTKRLRIFAGPNGFGKSTLANNLKRKIAIGVFVNADEIELDFINKGHLSLHKYKLRVDTEHLQAYVKCNTIIEFNWN